MALEGKGRVIQPSKGKIVIYIPAKVHNDSAFPFKPRQDVQISIKGDKLIIQEMK